MPPVWIEPAPRASDRPPLHPEPLLDALLAGRVADPAAAKAFLDPRPQAAPDPLLLPGMAAAAGRVGRALADREAIALYGDYDVDGVSSTALLARGFAAATGGEATVVTRLPTRREGYGLHPAVVEELAAAGASLLIAVDCASGDHLNVAHARYLGLDVVVLDHHQLDDGAPDDAVVVSSHLQAEAPYSELSAAGIAYLLAVALARAGHDLGDGPGREPRGLLDLCALGTVGDVVPLTGPNRPLVRDGLRAIAERPRVGIRALCQRAGVSPTTVTSEEVAFKLAPRLNAAGRMADPRLALDLLLTDDPRRAARLADELEGLNARRRAESQRVVAEAEEIVLARPDLADRRLLVVSRRGWGGGVLGLAAGRLVERFGRPVVVLADDGAVLRGSARSVPGFDIARALAGCDGLLEAHGGHSQAAGLTLRTAALSRLEAALEAAVAGAALPTPGAPALRIDADLPAARLDLATAELIGCLQPFGSGNRQPLLRLRDLPVRSYNLIGRDGGHLKLHLETPRGVVPALFWGAAARSRELVQRPRLDLVATVGVDHWNGQRRLQVEVKDFRPTA